MAAPSRASSGRRAERRRVSSTRWARTYHSLRIFVLGWLIAGISGCAWWREARDSLTHSQHLYHKALESESRGDHAEAVRLLRDSIAASPDDPELRWELAHVLIEHGETPEALKELRFLVRHYPDDCRAYISLSKTLLERGRAADAAHLADLAIDLDSRNTEARMLRGQIAEVRGDVDLAFETYHHVLREQPEFAEVRLRLASLELEHGEPRIAAAFLRETLTTVTLEPEQIRTAQWLLGTAYARDDRWAESAAALSLGIPTERPTMQQRYELAYAFSQAGDQSRAHRELQFVLNAEPNFMPAQQLLAAIDSANQATPSRMALVRTGHSQ